MPDETTECRVGLERAEVRRFLIVVQGETAAVAPADAVFVTLRTQKMVAAVVRICGEAFLQQSGRSHIVSLDGFPCDYIERKIAFGDGVAILGALRVPVYCAPQVL